MKVHPSKIKVGERQRKELGDLTGLKQSLSTVGQINPIIIDKDFNLVAGGRRLEACKQLDIEVEIKYSEELNSNQLRLIELEENIKRKDLTWQEQVEATTSLFKLIKELTPNKTVDQVAEDLNLSRGYLLNILSVSKHSEDERVSGASSFVAARNIASRITKRNIDDELSTISDDLFNTHPSVPDTPVPIVDAAPITQADFIEWAEAYTGPKFNLIHCDFPYGINHGKGQFIKRQGWKNYDDSPDIYYALCRTLAAHKKKLLTPKAHVLFWFSMKHHYDWTKTFFREQGFRVPDIPLIWHKTDNKGVIPDPTKDPRHIYETAFLMSLGDREIVKSVGDIYGCPSAKTVHTSEKPEPMLRYFFQMLVDEYTEILDPTAGSGSALRAAKSLGAKRVVGLELDQEHVDAANRIYLEEQRKAVLSDNYS